MRLGEHVLQGSSRFCGPHPFSMDCFLDLRCFHRKEVSSFKDIPYSWSRFCCSDTDIWVVLSADPSLNLAKKEI